jgi:hypothetical protein
VHKYFGRLDKFLKNENEIWGVKKVLNQNLNQKSKSFVVWTYVNIDKMFNVVIEVECVIKKLRGFSI